MPQHASPKKSVRQDKKRNLRNRSLKSQLKTTTKKLGELIKEKNIEEAQNLFKIVVSKIDKAAQKKIIHKNKAAREKSRLSRKIAPLGAQDKKETAA
ncbi:MAG: 30S ribosomal protein S20 [bacterium]